METPKTFTLGQAARETGVSKATLSKALKSGKLSYLEKTSAGYKIDPAELFRVYPKRSQTVADERLETPKNTNVNSVLEVKLEAEREMRARLEAEIEDLKTQRDEWQGQAKQLLIANQNQSQPVGQGGKLTWGQRLRGRV